MFNNSHPILLIFPPQVPYPPIFLIPSRSNDIPIPGSKFHKIASDEIIFKPTHIYGIRLPSKNYAPAILLAVRCEISFYYCTFVGDNAAEATGEHFGVVLAYVGKYEVARGYSSFCVFLNGVDLQVVFGGYWVSAKFNKIISI